MLASFKRAYRDFLRSKGGVWRLLFFVSLLLITTVLWLKSKPDLSLFSLDPVSWFMQLFGLFAIIFFAMNFVLATRSKLLEKWFGGLDVVYKAHHQIGGLAYVFMVLHFGFLLADTRLDEQLLAFYLTPNFNSSYFLGLIAFILVTALLLLTYSKKLPYHIWKTTHTFMGIGLLIAGLHAVMVPSDIARYIPLKIWIVSFVLIGLISAVYRRIIYKYFIKNYKYEVDSIRNLKNIVEVVLKPLGKSFSYRPGQFIFIKFKSDKLGNETHPFSISQADRGDGYLRLSMKKSGDYTNKLGELKVGDNAVIKGPYGEFGEKFLQISDKKRVVWIAGGIGITPFLSMLDHMSLKSHDRKVDLFYCVKENNETVYQSEIEEKLKKLNRVRSHLNISNQDGWLTFEKIKEVANIKADEKVVYMLCGPKVMMNGLEDQMVKQGVPIRCILYEDFTLLS